MPRLAFILPLLFLAAASMAADVPKSSAKNADGIRYFETHIRPLLAKHCYECHGEKEQESSLRLDTWTGLMKGGDAGTVIAEGKPAQSLLLTAVKYQDPNLQMPPETRLSKAGRREAGALDQDWSSASGRDGHSGCREEKANQHRRGAQVLELPQAREAASS